MNIQGNLAAKIDTRGERELRDVINPATGGVKQSGFGTEHGIEGLKEFTTIQTVHC